MLESLNPTALVGTALALVLALFVLPEVHLLLERRVSAKRRRQAQPEEEPVITVSTLTVYPVKSCGGVSVASAKLSRRGLEHDRQWMVVDGDTGNFLSQRQEPKLALVQPKALPRQDGGGALELSAPGMPDLTVPVIHGARAFSWAHPATWPLTPHALLLRLAGASNRRRSHGSHGSHGRAQGGGGGDNEEEEEGEVRGCKVWGDRCPGVDQGHGAAAWFEELLGRPGVRLVRFPDHGRRPTDPKYAPGFETGYSDGYPLLVASEESLADLNARIPPPPLPSGSKGGAAAASALLCPMNRFRPNLVVQGGGAPWLEDQWRSLELRRRGSGGGGGTGVSDRGNGSVACRLRIVKPCSRCKIPSIDQATGLTASRTSGRDDEGGGVDTAAEPTRTLKTFRTGKHLKLNKPSWRDEVFFGQNAVAVRGGGWWGGEMRVGDVVVVTKKQEWVSWAM